MKMIHRKGYLLLFSENYSDSGKVDKQMKKAYYAISTKSCTKIFEK